MFKGYTFPKTIIVQAVYFKFRFGVSYREIEEPLPIRGVKVNHATIQQWGFKFSKGIEHNMNTRKRQVTDSWRLGGKDRYLYRAVDKQGNTIDFLLTKRRMKGSAQKFLNKAIGNNDKP